MIKEMAGKQFGRLRVIAYSHTKNWKAWWLCRCKCGSLKITSGDYLRSGDIRSCGCLKAELNQPKCIKHGKCKTITYRCWANIKTRCRNARSPVYKYYGARGISVCKRWLSSYLAFLNDMGRRPSRRYSIDRINVNGNYEPSNCRWATPKQQANNKQWHLVKPEGAE